MSHGYLVAASPAQAELVVKKSRFIAHALPISERADALEKIEALKQAYPDARHHCWAYLLGRPGAASNAAMNDDGEPSGTAGKPILQVLEHKQVGDLLVVVVRYFGGIKLGAGGLVRAYAGATQEVMSVLEVTRHESLLSVELRLDFSQEQALRHWLDEQGARLVEVSYGQRVVAEVALSEALLVPLQEWAAARGVEVGR